MRIARAAWFRAKVSVLSLAGAAVMALGFAFVGAFFVLPAKNTWGERALNGLGAAAIALVVILAGAFLWHLIGYLCKRGRDRWRVVAFVTGNGIKFQLERHPEAMPEDFSEHGVIECEARTPAGEKLSLDVRDWGMDAKWVQISAEPLQYGRYDVWWYGSYGSRRNKRKSYEMVHTRFDLTESSGEVVGT